MAAAILTPGEQRNRLTAGVFLPTGEDEPLAVLERAFALAPESVLPEAVAAGVLDPPEAEVVHRAAELRREVVRVDELSREEYLALVSTSP